MSCWLWPYVAIWPKYGHMATYGHNQHDMQYGQYGYPRKEHEKCSSPVKELIDLDVWFQSYGQNKNFELFPYVNLLCKTKNGLRRQNSKDKILIFGFLQYFYINTA